MPETTMVAILGAFALGFAFRTVLAAMHPIPFFLSDARRHRRLRSQILAEMRASRYRQTHVIVPMKE